MRDDEQGIYFSKKVYDNQKLSTYEQAKDVLPEPILEGKESYVSCYEYAVQSLFRHLKTPVEGSGFVSNYVDAAFNANIFLWDTCFMTVFCNRFDQHVPGICSLDNFYRKQHADGEICREIIPKTGEDFPLWTNRYDKPLYSYFHNHYGYRALLKTKEPAYESLYKPDLGRKVDEHPLLTLDALNHPLLAFAEWQHYLETHDVSRLSMVLEPLYQYYIALVKHIKHQSGLYVTDWASMDNSPRNKQLFLGVDISSEMVLFAQHLIAMLNVLVKAGYKVEDYEQRLAMLTREKTQTASQIRALMWDEKTGFFYDLDVNMQKIMIKTAAAFWTLISNVATKEQQDRLVWYLQDPKTFNRLHRVPVLSADEAGYDSRGGYWRGSVWAPINTMVVLGLQACGYHSLAREIGRNDVDAYSEVFEKTGTIWENYPPDELTQGDSDHPDFVGWSGIAPIFFFLSTVIGLQAHRSFSTLYWDLPSDLLKKGSVGCKRYTFWGKRADFVATLSDSNLVLQIHTNDSFSLKVSYDTRTFSYDITGDATLIEEVL